MRIGRAIIIPAIVALGLAGSALVGSAMPAAGVSVLNAPVHHVVALPQGTNMFHH